MGMFILIVQWSINDYTNFMMRSNIFLLTQPWKFFGHHVFLQYTYPLESVFLEGGDAPPPPKCKSPTFVVFCFSPNTTRKERPTSRSDRRKEHQSKTCPKTKAAQAPLMRDEHTSEQFITTNPKRSPQMVV